MKKVLLLALIALSGFAEIIQDNLDEIENKMLEKSTGEQIAKKLTKKMNKNLPRKEDDFFETLSVQNDGKTIISLIRIYNEDEEIKNEIQENKQEIIKKLYEQNKELFCTVPSMKKIIYQKEINFTYFINDSKGRYIGGYEIKKEDCEEVEKKIKEEKKEGKKKAPLI